MSKRGVFEETKGAENPDAHLEQIRSILFGQQMQEFERKLQGLEQRVQENAGQMNQSLLDRIATLENRLVGLLQQEAEERQIADHSLQGSLDTAVDNLEGKLASQMKEMRADLKDQGKELHKKLDHLAASLQAAIDELRLHKTDRATLANLLVGLAEKLRKE
ncbi:hypothetical protein [Meiothermus hypogaeus]|uniref:Uncharacterized protein n=2 Tax=Meiothermus hypogaeus TaxID=884155 RepID=A0A511R634_9DEIN|nr:hypothetical protein [Meiothermus hypogaeus]RIH78555.1 hypothetical protein Mhypo_01551 [Meiothermus hypogaeus]GEM84486.1 hypothetical protein MHY01S_26520 [Meiothermus hypogaeus NBRC 106114]